MKPDIGIDKKDLIKVTEILQTILADETVLFQKTKIFHWNVTGSHFLSYHELFDKQAGEITETIDAIAERIRALGERVKATLAESVKSSSLKEQDKLEVLAEDMIKELLKDHEEIIRAIRKNLSKVVKHGDDGTADFLTSIMEEHEKTTFFLRSHLE
jgi:starvation-inducible DNA-binding protein